MKKVVAILVGCLIVAAAFAGGPDMPSPFVFSAVPTNAAAVNSTAGSVTSAVPLDAWIDTVIVWYPRRPDSGRAQRAHS